MKGRALSDVAQIGTVGAEGGGSRRFEKRLQDDHKNRRKWLSGKQREAVKRFMLERELSVRGWAAKAGVQPNALYMFLRGETEFLTLDTMDALVRVVPGATVAQLIGEEAPPPSRTERLPCGLRAAFGQWKKGIYPPPDEEADEVEFPLPANVPADEVVRLVCRHAEQLYPQGSFLAVQRPENWRRAAREGDKLVVVCERDGAWEVTVREVEEGMRRNRARPGGALLFRSNHPEHAAKVELPWPFVGQAWRDEGGWLWQCRGRVTMQALIEEPVMSTKLRREGAAAPGASPVQQRAKPKGKARKKAPARPARPAARPATARGAPELFDVNAAVAAAE